MANPRMLAFSMSLTLGKAHPYFYKGMVQPNYQAFAEQFDLIIEENFDDPAGSVLRAQPDIIMLDLGPAVKRVPLPDANLLRNAASHRPLVIYSTLDAHYHSHHVLAKYIDSLQPEAIFSHDFYHDYFPERWRSRQVFIPNSYNHRLFRHIDREKDIMCGFYGAGFFGSVSYPWRSRIAEKVIPEFPSYILPRPTGMRDHGIVGEPFVDVMNRTQFIFGCTSLKDIPVKKLFEVPACGSMLMTNASPVLEKLGFKDRVNCCFVDTDNVLQTIRFYLDNPDKYAQVVAAGRELVETQHRSHHRKHILNWWHAYQSKELSHQVVQISLMGDFKIFEREVIDREVLITPLSFITDNLQKARLAWRENNFVSSSQAYLDVVAIYPLMTEAVIGAVGALLMIGKLTEAEQHLTKYLSVLSKPGQYTEFSLQLILYAALLRIRLSEYDKATLLLSQYGLNSLIEYIEQPENLVNAILTLTNLDDFIYTHTPVPIEIRKSHFLTLLGVLVDSSTSKNDEK